MAEGLMKVEELPNYGKDLLATHWQSRVPLKKRLALAGPWLVFTFDLVKAIGIRGAAGFLQEVREEQVHARRMDWTNLQAHGISQRNLNLIIEKMVIAKVLADHLGLRKAAHLRRRLSEKIAYPVFEEIFASPETFIACGEGDLFTPFKQYFAARMEAMARAGLEKAVVVEDSPNTFHINIIYCAWAEVAKALGNGRYCYYSICHGHEISFPQFCDQAGFQYEHFGTLGQGEPYCDHRFVRRAAV